MAMFFRDEAEAICRIPLSYRIVKDSLVLLHNKRGIYTIRSGHHLARMVIRKENWAESSSRAGG